MTTKVHVLSGLANPYLKCDECGESVKYWHNPERCDCDDEFYNHPCEHKAGITSICTSWSPVDGCSCTEKH